MPDKRIEFKQFSNSVFSRIEENMPFEKMPKTSIFIIDDLLIKAPEKAASFFWRYGKNSPEKLLAKESRIWLKKLTKRNKKSHPEIVVALQNPKKITAMIFSKKFGILVPLRHLLPEAWRTLLILSSELQRTKIIILKSLSNKLTARAYAKLGLSKKELYLLLDLAQVIQPFIDTAYIEQITLEDKIPPKVYKTNDEEGDRYLFHWYNKKTKYLEKIPLSQALPLGGLKKLHDFAKQIESMLAEKSLPKTYRLLPGYLKKIATAFTTKKTDRKELTKMWHGIYKNHAQVLRSGCPIVINTPECTSFGHIEIELRLGLRTKETLSLESACKHYIKMGSGLLGREYKSNPKILSKPPRALPSIFIGRQPFAFGSNLFDETLAESYHGLLFVHIDAAYHSAKKIELPLLKKLFKVTLNQETYARASILDTARHEIAHEIISTSDKAVEHRMELAGDVVGIIEELKAETVGLGLAYYKKLTKKEAELILLAKLGTAIRFLTSKSGRVGGDGEDYYLCGVKIISQLLIEKNITLANNKAIINDPELALQTIVKIGEEMLAIYRDDKTASKQAVAYVKSMRAAVKNPRLRQFLKLLSKG